MSNSETTPQSTTTTSSAADGSARAHESSARPTMKRGTLVALAAGAVAVLTIGVGVTTVYAVQSGSESSSVTSEADAGIAFEAEPVEEPEVLPESGLPVAGPGQYTLVTVTTTVTEESWGSMPGTFVSEYYQPGTAGDPLIFKADVTMFEGQDPIIEEVPADRLGHLWTLPLDATGQQVLDQVTAHVVGQGFVGEQINDSINLELEGALCGGAPLALYPRTA